MVPRAHVTVVIPPDVAGVQLAGVTETKSTVVGSTSVTVTPVAALGPAFATVSVYVRFCPASTGLGPVLVMEMSAEGLTVVDAVAVRSAESGSAVGLHTIAVLFSVPTAEALGLTTRVIVVGVEG